MKLPKIIVILFLAALGIGLFFAFKKGVSTEPIQPQVQSSPAPVDPNGPPKIVSTKPDPLDENIVSASEIVEITFNRPLENVGEFKSRIEPKIDYKVELSGDRKTARIIPIKPYSLGTTYTLYIGPDSKFDGIGEWREDKTFHFKTITYRGV
ncbi:MAG: Ig-like domain-containing protein [Candidatus Daviesbacteria bacterium]|nr:Ig-like domain-containing protein [Candidatus Daviesbacteria bacterium]